MREISHGGYFAAPKPLSLKAPDTPGVIPVCLHFCALLPCKMLHDRQRLRHVSIRRQMFFFGRERRHNLVILIDDERLALDKAVADLDTAHVFRARLGICDSQAVGSGDFAARYATGNWPAQ